MTRRIAHPTRLALLTALALVAAFAGPALAQSEGNESDDGGDVNVDVDPNGNDNGGDGEPEEATGGWLASPTGVLVILVLALVIVGLIVAVAAKR